MISSTTRHEQDVLAQDEPVPDETVVLIGGPEPEDARGGRPRVLAVALVALLVLGTLLFVLFRWASYRWGHIVTHHASVKGFVTGVGSQLEGQVEAVLVEGGQEVVQGQLIARLKGQQVEARVVQARSELERAVRTLEVERLAIIRDRQALAAEIEAAAADLAAAATELTAAAAAASRWDGEYAALAGLMATDPQAGGDGSSELLASLAARAEGQRAVAVAELELAESELERAESEYGRNEPLMPDEFVSANRFAEVAAMRRAAQAAVATARANLALAEARCRPAAIVLESLGTQEIRLRTLSARDGAEASQLAARERLRTAEAEGAAARIALEGIAVRDAGLLVLGAQVDVMRSALDEALAAQEATQIRAPDEGWVVRRVAEPGVSVRVGDPIVSLWIGKRAWVEAWIDEKDLGAIAVGNPADVTVAAFRDEVLPGRVASFGVLTDSELLADIVPTTLDRFFDRDAKIAVRIELDQQPAGLLPGLSAVVGIRRTDSHTPPEGGRGDGG